MKRIFAAILIILLIFSGCGRNGSLGVSEKNITDTDILKIKIKEATNEQIALEITNESKNEVGYDECYTLEFKKDGEWHVLRPKKEASFIEVSYVLEKENTCTWGDKTSRIYGKLPEGEYRIVKEFTVYESVEIEAERLTLAAQFRIG